MITLSKKMRRNYITLSFVVVLFFLILISVTYAQTPEYKPLVGLPKLQTSGSRSLPEYRNAVYLLTIGLGALIGVVKISMAGVKYSLSDIVTHKSEAKEQIKGVLLGLAILLIPFIVLNTINPDLTSLDILKNAQKVNIDASSQGTGGTTSTQSSYGITNAACGSLHGTITGGASHPSCTSVPNMSQTTCDAMHGSFSSVDGTCNNIPMVQ